MTQHIQNFLRECTAITADGSLTTLDELEGVYIHWCSLRGEDVSETPLVDLLVLADGVESVTHDGADHIEGLVLTGPVVADFILTCDFIGAWGHAEQLDPGALAQVASAS